MSVAVHHLVTPYDPPTGAVTVATPSCCCCCCCLNTVAGVTAYAVASAVHETRGRPWRRTITIVLGLGAVVAGVFAGGAVQDATTSWWGFAAGTLTTFAIFLASALVSGRRPAPAIVASAVVMVVGLGAAVVEVLTFGLLLWGQLAAPLTAWFVVWLVGKARSSERPAGRSLPPPRPLPPPAPGAPW